MRIKPLSNKEVHPEINVNMLDIIADDGRTLYTIILREDGEMEISTGGCVKQNDVILDSNLEISPNSANMITMSRKPYK